MSIGTDGLARGWIEAWKTFDMVWLRRHLAQDFVHVSPLGEVAGRDAYLDLVEPMARKSVSELCLLETIVSGDRAAIRFENRTPRGVVESCDWIQVEGDTITEIRSFYDPTPIKEILSPEDQERYPEG